MADLSIRTLLVSVAATVVTSAIWFVLAWRTPTSTFHFAPIIAGVVGPYIAKSLTGPLPLGRAALVAALGLLVTLATSTALELSDRLRGPTFWSPDGAILEAVIFASAGAIAGVVYLIAGRATATVR